MSSTQLNEYSALRGNQRRGCALIRMTLEQVGSRIEHDLAHNKMEQEAIREYLTHVSSVLNLTTTTTSASQLLADLDRVDLVGLDNASHTWLCIQHKILKQRTDSLQLRVIDEHLVAQLCDVTLALDHGIEAVIDKAERGNLQLSSPVRRLVPPGLGFGMPEAEPRISDDDPTPRAATFPHHISGGGDLIKPRLDPSAKNFEPVSHQKPSTPAAVLAAAIKCGIFEDVTEPLVQPPLPDYYLTYVPPPELTKRSSQSSVQHQHMASASSSTQSNAPTLEQLLQYRAAGPGERERIMMESLPTSRTEKPISTPRIEQTISNTWASVAAVHRATLFDPSTSTKPTTAMSTPPVETLSTEKPVPNTMASIAALNTAFQSYSSTSATPTTSTSTSISNSWATIAALNINKATTASHSTPTSPSANPTTSAPPAPRTPFGTHLTTSAAPLRIRTTLPSASASSTSKINPKDKSRFKHKEPLKDQVRALWIGNLPPDITAAKLSPLITTGAVMSLSIRTDAAPSLPGTSLCIIFQNAESTLAFIAANKPDTDTTDTEIDAKALAIGALGDSHGHFPANLFTHLAPNAFILPGAPYLLDTHLIAMNTKYPKDLHPSPGYARRRVRFSLRGLFAGETAGSTSMVTFKKDVTSIAGKANIEFFHFYNVGECTVVFSSVGVAMEVLKKFRLWSEEYAGVSVQGGKSGIYFGVDVAFAKDFNEVPATLWSIWPGAFGGVGRLRQAVGDRNEGVYEGPVVDA